MRYRQARFFDIVVFLIPLFFSARLVFMWQDINPSKDTNEKTIIKETSIKKNIKVSDSSIINRDVFDVKPPPIKIKPKISIT